MRRAAAQGPERLRGPGPRDHRLHGGDRGHAGADGRPVHHQILKERDWLPGFTAGFTAVNRDESRHVGFGIKFLADAIKDDPANAKIIEATLKECLPVAPLVFVPPWVDDPYNFQTPFYHSSEIFAYAMKALSKKLAAMGLDPAMLAEGAPA